MEVTHNCITVLSLIYAPLIIALPIFEVEIKKNFSLSLFLAEIKKQFFVAMLLTILAAIPFSTRRHKYLHSHWHKKITANGPRD